MSCFLDRLLIILLTVDLIASASFTNGQENVVQLAVKWAKTDADMNRMLKHNKPLESDESTSETLIALASVANMNRILKPNILFLFFFGC